MVRRPAPGREAEVTPPSAPERLRDAAFDLFAARGFDATTVDDIAARAQVGRTTFFRHFRAKEDVVFPDHAALTAAVTARLDAAAGERPVLAVTEAAVVVLRAYVAEGERARARYRLVTSVEPLRARELASTQPYQRAFGRYLRRVLAAGPAASPGASSGASPGASLDASLDAEVVAAAVIAAHNHVLRRWLRGHSTDPERELREVLAEVVHRWTDPSAGAPPPAPGSAVVVVRSDLTPEEAALAVRDVLAPGGPRGQAPRSPRTC